jgi:hypothetical protein
MTTARIAVRRLALLLLLPGCHTWRPVALAPNTDFGRYAKMRVERREQSTNPAVGAADGSAGTSYSRVALHAAWVKGDTLFGWQPGRSTPVAIPVADVRRAEERRLSGWRTTLLVVAIPVGVIVAFVAAVYATPGGP